MSATREATARLTRAALGSASVVLALGFAACDRARTQPPEAGGADREVERDAGYTFTLDGKPFSPDILSLNGTPDDPREGDVVSVERCRIVLGPPGAYGFTAGEDRDRLLLTVDGGKKHTVAVRGGRYPFDELPAVNPLRGMPPEELRLLRGVRYEGWPEGLEADLARLDLRRSCIMIHRLVWEEEPLPPPTLPHGVRYLVVHVDCYGEATDAASLTRVPGLEFLHLIRLGASRLDASQLAACPGLRHLWLGGFRIENAGALGRLTELRELAIGTGTLEGIEFVRNLRNLRSVRLSFLGVTDLSALGELRSLERIEVTATPVSRLPGSAVPALRELLALSTALPDEELARFRAANPACRVVSTWTGALRAALEGVSRVRVRASCECCPGFSAWRGPIEIEDNVDRLVERIEIDETARDTFFFAVCNRSPTFEFLRGDTLAATLRFDHGESLCWTRGKWPGDALLTSESADFLVDWLAEHGVTGPKDEREEGGRREDAAARREEAYAEIIPRAVGTRLNEAASAGDVVAAFEEGIADPVARAKAYLMLFGADEVSWSIYAGLDEPLKDALLPSVPKEAMERAVAGVSEDHRGANGAARWLFSEEKWREVDPAALEEALSDLAARGLSHGRSINRRRTARALGEIGSPTAREALRSALAGEIVPDKLAGAELDEPGGMVSFRGGDSDAPDDCTDRAYAALVLARMGDAESLPAVRALAAEGAPEDRKTLARAIRLLEGKDEYEELEDPEEPEAEEE